MSNTPASLSVCSNSAANAPSMMMHSVCTPSLLNHISDPTAYFAVVADACEFNRGLTRNRALRMPFLDLATQTTQRPAPWLHRTFQDRAKDPVDGGTHVVLRYLRHRWRLDHQTPAKKRKLAADRLWYTLQTGLNAVGIPVELIPLVTKRAYAIAGLPVPASLAPHLDALVAKTTANAQTNGTPNPAVNRQHTGSSSTNAKRLCTLDPWSEPMARRSTGNCREDEDQNLDDNPSEETETILKHPCVHLTKHRASDVPTPVASGEDSLPSGENSAMKRNVVIEDLPSEIKTDDEVSVQSGNGTKLSSNSDTKNKTFDLVEDDSEDEDAEEEGDEEDEEEEEDDEFDGEEMDDDVEWVQPRGRRAYSSAFSSGRCLQSRRRKRSLKVARFSMANTRLSSRRRKKSQHRILQGHNAGMSVREKVIGGCSLRVHLQKTRPRASRSSVRNENPSAATVGRRSSRTPSALKAKLASVGGGTANREPDNASEEIWNDFAEPGFQPNVNFCSISDKNHEELRVGRISHINDLSLSNPAVHFPCSTATLTSITNSLSTNVIEDSAVLRESLTLPSSTSPNWDHRRHFFPSVINHPPPAPRIFSLPNSTTLQQIPAPSFSSSRPTMAQLLAAGTTDTSVGGSTGQPHTFNSFDHHKSNMETINRDGTSFLSTNAMPSIHTTVGLSSSQSSRLPSSVTINNGLTMNRTVDFPMSQANLCNPNNRPSPVSSSSTGEPFAAPQGATTTVTFFVCEVCASRYRSTAGLRYHYHSQHSGYTPKNPISASAARLVVPVGEERGIGGGLRGGRPRRHKAMNLDSRSDRAKTREPDSQMPCRLGASDVIGSSTSTVGLDNMDNYKGNEYLWSVLWDHFPHDLIRISTDLTF
ncbi:hypothetical protein P879_07300 [Paragonimus westermani]|uniref:C2H2-type domain-containing protein n=1 Tax=Paragonimus westermani TaxID=34504 RepID=A0A8T0CY35_9TREM|nr:hypothetical protein P879_07300 [Paragonimus westermani]